MSTQVVVVPTAPRPREGRGRGGFWIGQWLEEGGWGLGLFRLSLRDSHNSTGPSGRCPALATHVHRGLADFTRGWGMPFAMSVQPRALALAQAGLVSTDVPNATFPEQLEGRGVKPTSAFWGDS